MSGQALSLKAGNAIDVAISRVLEAERAASEDIAAAQREAAAMAEAARASVREIDVRTERRIRALREAFAQATDARLAALARAMATAEPGLLTSDDERRVEQAVARLAADLTGDDA